MVKLLLLKVTPFIARKTTKKDQKIEESAIFDSSMESSVSA